MVDANRRTGRTTTLLKSALGRAIESKATVAFLVHNQAMVRYAMGLPMQWDGWERKRNEATHRDGGRVVFCVPATIRSLLGHDVSGVVKDHAVLRLGSFWDDFQVVAARARMRDRRHA